MRTLYLDCSMGAAGDMLAAGLLELIDRPQELVDQLNDLGIPHVRFERQPIIRSGVQGARFRVLIEGTEEPVAGPVPHEEALAGHDHACCHHDHHHDHDHDHTCCHHDHSHPHAHHDHVQHDHRVGHNHGEHSHEHFGMAEIREIVSSFPLADQIKKDILAVYQQIGEAESSVHQVPITDIHFHEVGSLDAIADVTAVCLIMDRLAPDLVLASPVNVGSGHVRCAHGILPVPAPATALILRDVPIYSGLVESELCTPTGAALLKHFVHRFEKMPIMKVEKVGYGMGKKEFPVLNAVRCLLGSSEESGAVEDEVVELSCNIDDMTAEDLAYAMETIRKAGALDVYSIAIGMKKNRPGVMVNVLCSVEDEDHMAGEIFKHTTSLGIRRKSVRRYILNREERVEDSSFGPVRKKISAGFGVIREKWEFDDLAAIADRTGRSIQEIRAEIRRDED